MKNTKKIIAALLAVSMLAGCGNQPVNVAVTPTVAPTSAPVATSTPAPTATPAATATPAPTATPTPTPIVMVTPEYDITSWIASETKPLSIAANRTKEAGVIQVFGQSKETLEENQKLAENLEFTTRQMENLDRGLVAVNNGNGVFISWRWLGSE